MHTRDCGADARLAHGRIKSSLVSAAFAAAVLGSVCALAPRTAEADILLSQRGCVTYATWSGNLVWARNIGADKEKAKAELVTLDQKTPASIYTLILRQLDSLWTTSANWEQVTALVLQDCVNRLGRYDSGA